MDLSDHFHKNFDTLLWVTLSSLDRDCSNLCNAVVFPAPILFSMVTIGTCIVTTVLQNNLEAISTGEVLISSIIALQLLSLSEA